MKHLLNAALYFVVFMLIQIIVQGASLLLCRQLSISMTAVPLALTSIACAVVTIAVFACWRTRLEGGACAVGIGHRTAASGAKNTAASGAKNIAANVAETATRRRPWLRRILGEGAPLTHKDILPWVVLMAVGMTAPVQFVVDLLGLDMPETARHMFVQLLGSNWGFVAVAILVPVAEEMVFRGFILHSLTRHFSTAWWPVVLSALLFGMAHGNAAQFVNGFCAGLLLGWLYVRTGSIVYGVVYHMANNFLAFVLFRFMPGMQDMSIVDFFGGDRGRVAIYIFCSLCVLLPSLWQVKDRTR